MTVVGEAESQGAALNTTVLRQSVSLVRPFVWSSVCCQPDDAALLSFAAKASTTLLHYYFIHLSKQRDIECHSLSLLVCVCAGEFS